MPLDRWQAGNAKVTDVKLIHLPPQTVSFPNELAEDSEDLGIRLAAAWAGSCTNKPSARSSLRNSVANTLDPFRWDR